MVGAAELLYGDYDRHLGRFGLMRFNLLLPLAEERKRYLAAFQRDLFSSQRLHSSLNGIAVHVY